MTQIGFPKRASDDHIVAERYVGNPWPMAGAPGDAVVNARLRYERGEVEIASRREGRMEYLYAIPRKVRGTPRPGYFDTKH